MCESAGEAYQRRGGQTKIHGPHVVRIYLKKTMECFNIASYPSGINIVTEWQSHEYKQNPLLKIYVMYMNKMDMWTFNTLLPPYYYCMGIWLKTWLEFLWRWCSLNIILSLQMNKYGSCSSWILPTYHQISTFHSTVTNYQKLKSFIFQPTCHNTF